MSISTKVRFNLFSTKILIASPRPSPIHSFLFTVLTSPITSFHLAHVIYLFITPTREPFCQLRPCRAIPDLGRLLSCFFWILWKVLEPTTTTTFRRCCRRRKIGQCLNSSIIYLEMLLCLSLKQNEIWSKMKMKSIGVSRTLIRSRIQLWICRGKLLTVVLVWLSCSFIAEMEWNCQQNGRSFECIRRIAGSTTPCWRWRVLSLWRRRDEGWRCRWPGSRRRDCSPSSLPPLESFCEQRPHLASGENS